MNPDPNPMLLVGTCIPRGDGSFIVRTGKPLARLTVRQLSSRLGVSARTVYRYIEQGVIPDSHVECVGIRRLLLRPEVVEFLLEHFRKLREDE